jgi:hypothetical protein
MPDLHLIKQAEQECGRFGKASSAISPRTSVTTTGAGDFAADLLQMQ